LRQKLVIGTRGSQLALWQANWVKSRLEQAHLGLSVELRTISTKGDRVLDVSLPKLGEQGKGLFTKELEDGLYGNEIDLAVHSLKDLPTELPTNLQIGAVCEREDVRDALVARPDITGLNNLPQKAIVGTSSLRRSAQLRAARPDFMMEAVRGNVETRLRKLDAGNYDAIVLAAAGLIRLGYLSRITEFLDADFMLSAVGQGALAIETRSDDERVNDLVSVLDHKPTRLACCAERAFLKGLGGGCLVPIAALGIINDGNLKLAGLVADVDGSRILRGSTTGAEKEAETIGEKLAEDLLSRGAAEILRGRV
jgi:hydroxymethylbilane synthase